MCEWKNVQGTKVKYDCGKTTCTHSDCYIPPADRGKK